MKYARDLSPEQLANLVEQVQQILYLSANAQGMIWDPDKERDSETTEAVAAVLEGARLQPEGPLPWQPPPAADSSSVQPQVLILPPGQEARVQEFFERKLGEWLNDGQEEVIRVLTLWATREGTSATPRIELGAYLEESLAPQADDEGSAEAESGEED
jgi:hypothetical protein